MICPNCNHGMVIDSQYIGCYHCGQTYTRPGSYMLPSLKEMGLYCVLGLRYKTVQQLELVQMGETQSCLQLP